MCRWGSYLRLQERHQRYRTRVRPMEPAGGAPGWERLTFQEEDNETRRLGLLTERYTFNKRARDTWTWGSDVTNPCLSQVWFSKMQCGGKGWCVYTLESCNCSCIYIHLYGYVHAFVSLLQKEFREAGMWGPPQSWSCSLTSPRKCNFQNEVCPVRCHG